MCSWIPASQQNAYDLIYHSCIIGRLSIDASCLCTFQEAEEKNADLLKFPDQLENLKEAVE